jgi:hypothetical protein
MISLIILHVGIGMFGNTFNPFVHLQFYII